jgi:radical SAM superfamily enzyme YgiQ (UPF0313 family)
LKLLLAYPNAQREIIGYMDMGAIAEPIALEYVAAGAALDGHEVRLIDLRLHREALDPTLLEFKPDVVAVTGYSMHVLRNLEICRRVKELVPGCRTAAGGHHATLEPVDYCEPEVDFVCVDEGVAAFRTVLRRLESGDANPVVPGVWSRVGDEFRFGGKPEPYDANLLPHPQRTMVPDDRSHYFIDYMKPIALMRTTVGCPYRCSFCSLWRIMDGRYYTRHVDDVVAELKEIPEHHVHLADDEPFVNGPRMKSLAEAIEAAGIEKEYYAYCRVDSFLRDRALMKQWRDIGLRRLFFGIESVLERELVSYNKKQSLRQIVEAVRVAKDMGLGLFCGFIVHPSYTPEDFDELKGFIRAEGIDYPSFTIWTPIPGIADGGTDYGQVVARQPNGRPDWSQFDLQHATIPSRLPLDEFMHLYHSLWEVSHFTMAVPPEPLAPPPQDESMEAIRNAALIKIAIRALRGN